jgi:membrane protease YdiL (CAAX protease family)
MNQPEEPLATPPVEDFSVPWTVADTWLGLLIFVLVVIGQLVVAVVWHGAHSLQSVGLVAAELLYLVPVAYILARRKVPWKTLGFRAFDQNKLALGCGLLVIAYLFILLHNIILSLLGVTTQGDAIYRVFSSLDSPIWLILVGVLLAPFVEEMFFRGFLFAGFRQGFSWNKAALLSSALFALAHLQLAALIPTFILGYLLAYIFHKSNSLWPGIILHFLVNSIGLGLIFALSQFNL